ncbi:MAG: GPW/gp25 family protein [Deltaproteobacteria bacterium]|nr:GPW/gp25 family protein [Deltaproteobacteria bacterium]
MESRFLQMPFNKGHSGGAAEIDDIDQHIKDKMMQVLFTVPGERVNLPDFGCGIRDLVFEGNNETLAATVRYKIFKAVTRWMGDEVKIDAVNVFNEDETLFIQIFYQRLDKRIAERLEVAYKL